MMRTSLFLLLFTRVSAPLFSQEMRWNLDNATGNLTQYLMNVQRSATETASTPSEITAFNNAPNTIGKRFMFDHWVRGDSVVLIGKGLLSADNYLFNYDKLTGTLIGTEDKTKLLSATAADVNSFILYDGEKSYHFVKLKPTDSKFSLELVSAPDGYALFKKTNTTLKKADFRSDGLIQTGSRDDEFKDAEEFYITDATGKIEQVFFRAKSIRQTLPGKRSAIDRYFRVNWEKHINEEFLTGLIQQINGL